MLIIVYWIGVKLDITDMILRCNKCTDDRFNSSKKPLQPTQIAEGLCQMVRLKLIMFNNEGHLKNLELLV